jgi:hypothetical protein
VDSLKVLDPEGPIREADIARYSRHVSKAPKGDINWGQSPPHSPTDNESALASISQRQFC